MPPSRFVASRSSRHRTAALALYRSLLRSAKLIPVAEGSQPADASHPVTQVVRKRFAKNKSYTSFRLIFAGMTAGYKFLGLFTKAQTPGSAEHTQVLNYLHTRPVTSRKPRAVSSPSSSSSSPIEQPRRPQIPILTKISRPGQPPEYAPSLPARSKESFKGDRPIPRIAATADGLPLLRMKKPQPPGMAAPLMRKINAYQRAMLGLKDSEGEAATSALLEDEWDHIIEKELNKKPGGRSSGLDPYNSSFAWTMQLSHLWWEFQVEKIWEDWKARGLAMNDLVLREKALAEQEARQVGEHGQASSTQQKQNDQLSSRRLSSRSETKVQADENWTQLASYARAAEPDGPTPEEIKDPYIARSWRAVVEGQNKRLRRALETQVRGRDVGFEVFPKTRPGASRK